LAAARRREETSTFSSTGSVARDGSTGRWVIDDLGWPDVIAAFVLIHDGRPRIDNMKAEVSFGGQTSRDELMVFLRR
jgi:hypothetical protein